EGQQQPRQHQGEDGQPDPEVPLHHQGAFGRAALEDAAERDRYEGQHHGAEGQPVRAAAGGGMAGLAHGGAPVHGPKVRLEPRLSLIRLKRRMLAFVVSIREWTSNAKSPAGMSTPSTSACRTWRSG